MTRLRRIALAILCAALIAVAAKGFALIFWNLLGGTFVAPFWAPGANPTWFINDQIPTNFPNLEPGSQPVAALQAAMSRAGQLSGQQFNYGGTTTIANIGGLSNVITAANTPTNLAFLQGFHSNTLVNFNSLNGHIMGFSTALSPTDPFSTLGTSGRFDLEATMMHEAGHVVGIDHSPLFNATMYPILWTGTLKARSLDRDDQAAYHFRYGTPASGPEGTVIGTVEDLFQQPVDGAHLALVDVVTGRVEVGAISVQGGNYVIPGVSPGIYHLYVEPLDGPFTETNLITNQPAGPGSPISGYTSSPYWTTAFKPGILGDFPNPTVLRVRANTTTFVSPLPVDTTPAVNNVTQVFFNTTPTPAGAVSFLDTPAPFGGYAGIFGTGVHLPPDSAFSISGPFLMFSGPSTWSSSQAGFDDRIFPLDVPIGTPPGSYVMRMHVPQANELVFFPGCLEVAPNAQPTAWAAPYGTPSLYPGGTLLILTANGQPASGNGNFALNVTGTSSGQTVHLLVGTAADWVELAPLHVLGVDLDTLLFPFPDVLPLPASGGTLTIPLPLPSSSALAGLELFVQAFVADPAAPFGVRLSNALALHFE